MRYVQINAYANGWADSIIFKKHRELQAQGDESYVFWARGEHEEDAFMKRIASYPEVCLIHARLGLEKGRYFLLSAHREENIDDGRSFRSLFGAVNVSEKVVKIIQSYTGIVNKMVWRKR